MEYQPEGSETKLPTISTDPQALEAWLSKTPTNKLASMKRWETRRRNKRKRESARSNIRKQKKKNWIYYKFMDLRKQYRQRKRYSENPEQAVHLKSDTDRYKNSTHDWNMSLPEFKQAYASLFEAMGYTLNDSGLGGEATKPFWNRKHYGVVKMGRQDLTKPFEVGNIQFFVHTNRKEAVRLCSEGYSTPKGWYKVEPLTFTEGDRLIFENIPQPRGQAKLTQNGANTLKLIISSENSPYKGGSRLVLFEC